MPWVRQCFERPQPDKERLKISELLGWSISVLKCPAWGPVSLILVSTKGPQLRLRSWRGDGGHCFQKFRYRQLKLASQKQVFLTQLLKTQNSPYGEIKWWACAAGSHSHSIQPQFNNDRNLFFKAGCLSRLGQHQFAPSGDWLLPIASFHSDTIFSWECKGLNYLGVSKGWS